MTDLHSTILQKASGETRLDPDQQRKYMGTFRERVVLILNFEEANHPDLAKNFASICQKLLSETSPLFLKLSPSLSDSLQIALMKIAQQGSITASIIDEKVGASPYALLFHTDHAVDKEDIAFAANFPEWMTKTEKKEDTKPSFWKKLFG
ncbi:MULTISPECIES: DUF1694 domain-containing protein [Streptococcus]|uniref:DUF1694 domain-containing protein n=1 Tax=Streptococcus TaxID=1301 RepID=UPI000CF391D7|nr:YueI family protein [Streptococcus suis]NQH96874.1 YueI family protein [Streptococcus suis]NQP65435.1 YueI family protein [Streptococcus suis]